jgi:hypothetical protein
MKALIVGLLGLTVLAGCATTPDMKVATTDKLDEIPPAGVGFCNANDGVYVVLLGTDGKVKEFACPSKGNKKITQPDKIPNLPNSKEIKLGTTYKFFDSTDPCYVWVFGGSRYHVCWEEII